MTHRTIAVVFSIFLFGFLVVEGSSQTLSKSVDTIDNNQRLWFTGPAEDWNSQALHLGNGYMGVSFFGGVEKERFDFTDKTAWLGGPGENPNWRYGIRPGGKEHLKTLRDAIVNEEYAKADQLASQHFTGDYHGFGSFSCIGRLFLSFENQKEKPENYLRELNLAESVGRVAYTIDQVRYVREYFCSYPDRLLAIRLSADKNGKISFALSTEILHKEHVVTVQDGTMDVSGTFNGNGRQFRVKIQVRQDGGAIADNNKTITVTDADEAVILLTVATEYLPNPPKYQGANPESITAKILEKASDKSYEELKKTHQTDYQALYNRVHLTLGSNEDGGGKTSELPSNIRRERLKQEKSDPGLQSLLFNYGRYMLISASRAGAPPSNLQGTWATGINASWSGNYQSNINLQEMYYACGPTNLPECQVAYNEWIKGLVVPGRETANAYYGTKGWVSHTTGNIWGYTAPGAGILWGMYPVGAAWHCHYLWEHYAFTGDRQYLAEFAYPIMKEAAEFWLANLTEYAGYLISAPSVSSEHGADFENGKFIDPTACFEAAPRQGVSRFLNIRGPYQDIEMIHGLFGNVLEAAGVLGVDKEFCKRVEKARAKLLPLKIGRLGQLQEWADDIDSPLDHHRHISHLWAVHPGRQIHPHTTPSLAAAAIKSLDLRRDGREDGWPYSGGNWARAWRAACWARLLDGDRANKILTEMIIDEGHENLLTGQHLPNGHLVMQVDGSMAYPGIVAEMLVQSHLGEIDLLPSLPKAWPSGEVRGLLARGGYQVDMKWKDGLLQKATITALHDGNLPKIRIAGKSIDLSKEPRIQFSPKSPR